MCESEVTATEKGMLLAWVSLVVTSTLLIVGVRLVYDVPDDLRYRYSTVVFAVLVSAAQLGVILIIARRGRIPEMLALASPTSWRRAAEVVENGSRCHAEVVGDLGAGPFLVDVQLAQRVGVEVMLTGVGRVGVRAAFDVVVVAPASEAVIARRTERDQAIVGAYRVGRPPKATPPDP